MSDKEITKEEIHNIFEEYFPYQLAEKMKQTDLKLEEMRKPVEEESLCTYIKRRLREDKFLFEHNLLPFIPLKNDPLEDKK